MASTLPRRDSRRSPRRSSALWPLLAAGALTLSGCKPEETPVEDGDKPTPALADKVLVVGHRGASALRPEHTLEAYRQAIADGADIIEPDLVPTKDGVLVARHENEISGTTNVSSVAKFADRKKTKTIDGTQFTGWFTEDFTLAELRELRARERIPDVRPDNKRYDDQFLIPTLAEIITLAQEMSASTGRVIPIYPETKHPTYFQSIGLPLEDRLITALRANPFTASGAPVYIQSFETTNLKEIRRKIGTSQPKWLLVQLMEDSPRRPYDLVTVGDPRTYADLATAAGMKEIATYANAVGPYKLTIINVDSAGVFQKPSDLVRNAHAEGLLVFPFTFRPENNFLPTPLKTEGPATTRHAPGSVREIQTYLRAGIDGFFTDDPAVGRQAVDTYKP